MIIHLVLGAPREEPLTLDYQSGDLCVGVDYGAIYLLNAGYPVDLAIGDFDSVTEHEWQQIKNESQRVEKFQADKDDTDTELALLHALNLSDEAPIHIHNWIGGRLDHFLSILYLVYQERFQAVLSRLVFCSPKNSLRVYQPGHYQVEQAHSDNYLSYIGLTPIKGLTLRQVKYTLESADYDVPRALVSNEFLAEGQPAEFSFESGLLAVIQSRD